MSFFRFGIDDLDLLPDHSAKVIAFPLDHVRGNRHRATAIAEKIAYLLPDREEEAKQLWVEHIAQCRAALKAQGLPPLSIIEAIDDYTARVRQLIAQKRAPRK